MAASRKPPLIVVFVYKRWIEVIGASRSLTRSNRNSEQKHHTRAKMGKIVFKKAARKALTSEQRKREEEDKETALKRAADRKAEEDRRAEGKAKWDAQVKEREERCSALDVALISGFGMHICPANRIESSSCTLASGVTGPKVFGKTP